MEENNSEDFQPKLKSFSRERDPFRNYAEPWSFRTNYESPGFDGTKFDFGLDDIPVLPETIDFNGPGVEDGFHGDEFFKKVDVAGRPLNTDPDPIHDDPAVD